MYNRRSNIGQSGIQLQKIRYNRSNRCLDRGTNRPHWGNIGPKIQEGTLVRNQNWRRCIWRSRPHCMNSCWHVLIRDWPWKATRNTGLGEQLKFDEVAQNRCPLYFHWEHVVAILLLAFLVKLSEWLFCWCERWMTGTRKTWRTRGPLRVWCFHLFTQS